MRSIRLSLTVYFLLLMAVAMGVVSVFVYQSSEDTLADKQKAAEEVLQGKYKDDRDKEMLRLDNALLHQARMVGQLAQFQSDWSEVRWSRVRHWDYKALGLLGALPQANGHVLATFWAAQGATRSSFSQHLRMRIAGVRTEIILTHSDPLAPVDPEVLEYFQINSAWGASYHSQSLTDRSFAFDPGVFDPKHTVVEWEFDDTTLGDKLVRRVTFLLAPSARRTPFSRTPSRPGERSPEKTQRPSPAQRPTLCIQYACETGKRDRKLADFQAGLDSKLADLENQTNLSLATLRTRLFLMNVAVFATILLGTCLLVGVGLAPLRRLSEAVSQVSEKDIHLHFEDRDLPVELTPIVDRLRLTLEQLKRAFAREKQATADISHELRTPLAALTTTIDVALRKPRDAESYREALQDCRASAQQIHEAIEKLLALARLDAGVAAVRIQVVDAARLAEQCVSVVRPLAEVQGLRVSLHGDKAVPVHTDPDKLREILNNLLHNAIQYNQPQGCVDVTVVRQNGHVCLEVRDTGIGIPDSARDHIFERFYRADPSRQSDGLHAGLGLAIVKGYIDLMGGTIAVESVQGQGSSFLIQLPA